MRRRCTRSQPASPAATACPATVGGGPTRANTYQAINYWVDVLFNAQPAATLTSIAVTPANGTLTVGATQPYTATGTYSDSSTQNLTSQVTWASSNTAAATIDSTGLATAVAAGSTTISATLGAVSGSTGLSITVNSSTTTIWPSNPTPAIVDGGDTLPVVLGVKFRSDVAGFIKGVRFYKAATNTGTHVGTLWSGTGQSLATATFTGETASGWQQVTFATPVAIQANTVYVPSYFAPNGHYSGNPNYFATQGVDTPPLHALANGVAGGNGVFAYGGAGAFPNSTYQALNYWVDVVFSTSAQ